MKVAKTAVETKMTTISGTVDSVTYRNDDNGFAVAVLDYEGSPLTIVGSMGNVEEGRSLSLQAPSEPTPSSAISLRLRRASDGFR